MAQQPKQQYVQTPIGMRRVLGATTTPNQRKTMRRLISRYDNLNGYDVGAVYIDSHRPIPDGLDPEIENGEGGFMIHSVRPTEHKPSVDGIVTNDITQRYSFDIAMRCPEVPPDLVTETERHWRSLVRGVSTYHFLRRQAMRHLKFHKLKFKNIFRVGLQLGKALVSSLKRILEEKGYKAGNLYDCQQLVNDIQGELGGARVAFNDLSHGQVLKVKCLDEVCVLYDKDAETRVQGVRKQGFEVNDIFLFETLQFRFRRQHVRQTATKEAPKKSEKRRKRKASNLVANEDGGEEPAIGESGEEIGMVSAEEVIVEMPNKPDKKASKKSKKKIKKLDGEEILDVVEVVERSKEAPRKSEKRRKRKASNLVANEDGGEEPARMVSAEEVIVEMPKKPDKKASKKSKKKIKKLDGEEILDVVEVVEMSKEAPKKSEKRRKRKASNLVGNEDGGEEPAIGESGEETGMVSAEVIVEMPKKPNKKASKKSKKKIKKMDEKENLDVVEVLERRSFGSGEVIEELRVGDPHGNLARVGDSVGVRYTCWLMETGEMFHSNNKETHPFQFVLGGNQVYRGWNLAVFGMHLGGRRRIHIPSSCLSHGTYMPPLSRAIPPGFGLVFEVDLTDIL